MYGLIQVGKRTYYMDCPSKIGIYRMEEDRVCLVDSGNDKDAGKRVWKLLEERGWKLDRILNTHSHADHIGGNAFLQQKSGCKIYCAGIDRMFVENPVLEPSFLYGGNPHKGLRNKFLCAKPSVAQELTKEALPEGMGMLRIDGHSFSMSAFCMEDGIWFVADGVTPERIMEKYHVTFLYAVEEYLASLEKLGNLEGRLFIPSHGEAVTQLKPLAEKNRDKVYEIRDALRRICASPVGNEEILKAVFEHYGLVMDASQYALVGSAIHSYLSWMTDKGELEQIFAQNRPLWKYKGRQPDGAAQTEAVAQTEAGRAGAGDALQRERFETETAFGCSKGPKKAAGIPVDSDPVGMLKEAECFALDMDGTVYLGEQWIDGAKEFLAHLDAAGKQYVFLTNNSSKNRGVYVEKLRRMGLEAGEEKIITSGQAAVSYLKRHYAGRKVFLLGNPMLQEEFVQEGIFLEEEKPDVVVTAFDTTIDYGKMCKVCDFIRAGLPYLATHPDYNCPTENGFIPDAGAIHAFIHASTGRYPDRIVGKPNGDIVDFLLERTGAARSRTVMVGDRLYTDIAAGVRNGLRTALVLSGEASLEELEKSEVKPDLIFHSVKEMMKFL